MQRRQNEYFDILNWTAVLVYEVIADGRFDNRPPVPLPVKEYGFLVDLCDVGRSELAITVSPYIAQAGIAPLSSTRQCLRLPCLPSVGEDPHHQVSLEALHSAWSEKLLSAGKETHFWILPRFCGSAALPYRKEFPEETIVESNMFIRDGRGGRKGQFWALLHWTWASPEWRKAIHIPNRNVGSLSHGEMGIYVWNSCLWMREVVDRAHLKLSFSVPLLTSPPFALCY